MIVKVAKIKFERFLQIGPTLNFDIKKYLDRNTGSKYMNGLILNLIYEFRFINGKRYTYKHRYKKCNLDDITEELIQEMINPVKEFIDLVILYIEKE